MPAQSPWQPVGQRPMASPVPGGAQPAAVCYLWGMRDPELDRLETLAEIDSLLESLRNWADGAPDWPPAQTCRNLVRRLVERIDSIRLRLECPLVVATLGGTGVGKSALVNALVGDEVVETGRNRPTTDKPTMVAKPGITPGLLGIPASAVEVVHRELPALARLVVIDCPDPDTTESPEAAGTNLARLRQVLPHCDVILVASTQQKYRSARVAEELAAAAAGARLVFVQTHADRDADIRDDWRRVLAPEYAVERIFRVDSLAALADAQAGRPAQSDFADLVDLLARQLAGAAAARIRRANVFDLVSETLAACQQRLEACAPALGALREALEAQRTVLANRLIGRIQAELLASRRQWDQRVLGRVVARWGLSPFALVLRVYQGFGVLVSGALLLRARSPAQMALWGLMEAARSLRTHRQRRQAMAGPQRALAEVWGPVELRQAALVLEGYAAEAGLSRQAPSAESLQTEAAAAGQAFMARAAAELDELVDRLAARHTGWWVRLRYELALGVMLGLLLYRPARNFFYDSWLADPPAELLGLQFYLLAAFWLAVWCGVLVWAYTSRLRKGVRREVAELARRWSGPDSAEALFATIEAQYRQAERFRQELRRLEAEVSAMAQRVVGPTEPLAHRRPGPFSSPGN